MNQDMRHPIEKLGGAGIPQEEDQSRVQKTKISTNSRLIHQLNKSMRSLPLHLRENKRVTCKVNKSNHPATRSGLGGSGGIILSDGIEVLC
jgi:hypothetical protein